MDGLKITVEQRQLMVRATRHTVDERSVRFQQAFRLSLATNSDGITAPFD